MKMLSLFDLPDEYSREAIKIHQDVLDRRFTEWFARHGFLNIEPAAVTRAKEFDPTTRFIGSHTSVLKNRIFSKTVPDEGISIVQPCINSKNFSNFMEGKELKHGSLFQCHGLLAPVSALRRSTEILANYFEHIRIIDRVVWQVNSSDPDLIGIVESVGYLPEVDTLPLSATRHQFGDARLTGRDIRLELRSRRGDSSVPFAVIVVLSLNDQPEYLEITISPGRILQQQYDLPSYLDTFPVLGVPQPGSPDARIVEDCIIAITILLREGLTPGGTSNQRRILRRYMCFLSEASARLLVSNSELLEIMANFEYLYFGDTRAAYLASSYLGSPLGSEGGH